MVDGGPLQPSFGLSGDVQSSNSVIPAGANHRESDDLRSGEPALSEVEGDLVFNVCPRIFVPYFPERPFLVSDDLFLTRPSLLLYPHIRYGIFMWE